MMVTRKLTPVSCVSAKLKPATTLVDQMAELRCSIARASASKPRIGSLAVPVTLGETYYLSLKHDSAKAGKFDFYVVQQSQGGSNPVEKNEAANDSKDTAEPLAYEKNSSYKGFYVAGNLISGGKDVDWYSVTVGSDATGNDFNIYCFNSGSGLEGLQVSLTEADGTPVVWAQEEPENMGAWRFLRVQWGERIFGKYPLSVECRPASASPATGSHKSHDIEQDEILTKVIGKSTKPAGHH